MVRSIPASEDGHGVLYIIGDKRFVISQNTRTEKFTLWEECKDGYDKICTADTPIKIYDKIEKMYLTND